jgi:hypothetical protein
MKDRILASDIKLSFLLIFIMKLFLVQSGYFYFENCDGLKESHSNFLVAESFESAHRTAKALTELQQKRMNTDGLQENKAI